VNGGRGWAVVQAQLHPRQREQAPEFRAFPNALLENMSYRLAQSGLQLPDDLRAATIERSAPTGDFLAAGEACLLTVNDTNLLGWARRYQDYQAFVTIYQDDWLAALLPHGHACALTTQ
jgi:hypothetical protein